MNRMAAKKRRLNIESLELRDNPATFTPTTFDDVPIVGPVNSAGQFTSGGNTFITLRSAIVAANASGSGTDTINLLAGTYNITSTGTEFSTNTNLNDLDVTASGLTINGAGINSTIIQAGSSFNSRIFDVVASSTFSFGLSNLTVKGGRLSNSDGAGLRTSGSSTTTTITNVKFEDNDISGSDDDGGAIYHGGGTLNISGSVFTGNASTGNGGRGGAIAATDTVNINTSSFINNTSDDGGGAIYLYDTLAGTSLIQRNSFTTNSVTDNSGRGGALRLNNTLSGGASLTINFNRFVGNTAASTNNGTAVSVTASQTVAVDDNWWGTNTPSGNDLDTSGGGANLNRTTWLTLRHAASPTTINTLGTSTLTADILGRANSGGALTATAASNLTGLPAFTATFNNPQLGALSGASANFVNGVATATFTAGNTAGTGQATAVADNQSSTANITINSANVAPTITSANAATLTVGSSGTINFTTTGTPAPTITLDSTLPSGLTFNGGTGTASITGTPAAGTAGTYTFNVIANNGVGAPAVQAFTLTINQVPAFTSPNNTTFTVGTNTTFTFATTGSPAATITKDATPLPGGLTFTSGTGTATLSGTPNAGTTGTYTFTLTATNGVGAPVNQTFTLNVVAAPVAPAITSANNTAFTIGTLGSFTFTATGSPTPTIVKDSFVLPAGLTFVTGTGSATLSGTPAVGTQGNYSFTITADNGVAPAATQTFSFTIGEPLVAPTFLSAGTTTFTRGQAGTFAITTTASNPANPTITATGTLPFGIQVIDNGNGTATLTYDGNPSIATGSSTFVLNATNGVTPNGSQLFSLVINPEMTISPSVLPAGSVTAPYNAIVNATGGTGAVNLVVSNVQNTIAGLNIPTSGAGAFTITGTPSASGTVTFTVTATDSLGATTVQNYSLTVNTQILFAPVPIANASFNNPYSETINITGGTLPYSSIQIANLNAGTTGLTAGNFTIGATSVGIAFIPTGNGTATFDVVVTDTAGATSTQSYSITVSPDVLPPTVTVSAPTISTTRTGPSSYTITYADANFGSSSLDLGDIFLNATGTATGTVSLIQNSPTSYTVTIDNITGDGTLSIAVAANTAVDLAGNPAPAVGTTLPITVDNTAPLVNISTPVPSQTAAGPITYTVSYTDTGIVTPNLTLGDLTLNATGTATGTLSITPIDSTSYTVAINGITGNGTIGFTIGVGTATDAAGNSALGATSSIAIVDNTAPTVTIGTPSATITAGGPISYTVTYADLNGVTPTLALANLTLNTTGTATGTLGLVQDSPTTYTVTIGNITGNGTVGFSLAAGTATDSAGNAAPAAISGTVLVDNTAPTVTIGAPSVTTTTGGPVSYAVTYADNNPITPTLSLANLTLNTTGTATGVLSLVQNSPTTYTVTISTITGDGTVGFSIAAGTATDVAGLTTTSATSATVLVDNTNPVTNVTGPTPTITRTGPATYTISYVDDNFSTSTLSLANLTLNTTGTATGTLNLVQNTPTTYTVTITGITGDGTLGFTVAAGTASDTTGNLAPAATSATVLVDNTAPTVTIGTPSATITAGGPISYTVTYADLNGVTPTLALASLTLNTTGTATGTLGVVQDSPTTYTVTISNITGNGTVGFSLAAGTASDTAGNTAAGATSTTVLVDNTAPTVSIGAPTTTITNDGPVSYTVIYSDANGVTPTLTLGNLTLNATGTANGTLSLVQNNATTYTVTISNTTGNGTLGFSIASGTATDTAGNSAAAPNPSATFVVDNVAPTVTISTPSSAITRTGPITYTVTYADANGVTPTLTASNLSLNSTGNATGTLSVVQNTPTTYTVSINGITGNGTLGFSIAAGTATDTAGNSAVAAGPSSTVIVDNTAPTVTISTPSATITKAGPITYTITYADANLSNTSLTLANLTLNRTGTANGTLALQSGANNTYTVTITNITGDGTLSLSVAAGTAIDLAGNSAGAAGPSASVIVDNTAPVVAIGQPSVNQTAAGPIDFIVTVTEANPTAFTLTPAQITLVKTNAKSNATITVTPINATTYQVTLSNITGGRGKLGIRLAAGLVTDQVGNTSAGPVNSNQVTITGTRVLRISHSGIPSFVNPGSTHTFAVNYRNTGTQTATNTTLYVTLPAYSTLDTAASTAGWQLVSGRRYKLVLGNVNAGTGGQALLVLKFGTPPRLGFAVNLTSVLTDDQSGGRGVVSAVNNFTIGRKPVVSRARW